MPSFYDLMVAPNGARLTKADHPGVPITPEELAQTAKACREAGATSIHMHVRNDAEAHSLDPVRFHAALGAVAEVTDIARQITTEAVGRYDVAAQINCIRETRAPDASVAFREMARAPELFAQAYQTAVDVGTDVQHIVYDDADLIALKAALDDGTIPDQFNRVLFVLGRYSDGQVATPDDLNPFLTALGDTPLRWSVCAFGPNEQECLLTALDHGGSVRIGFENNRTAPDGSVFPSNEAAVAAFVRAAAQRGFHPK